MTGDECHSLDRTLATPERFAIVDRARAESTMTESHIEEHPS
jgi:hypothetical protein